MREWLRNHWEAPPGKRTRSNRAHQVRSTEDQALPPQWGEETGLNLNSAYFPVRWEAADINALKHVSLPVSCRLLRNGTRTTCLRDELRIH